MEIGDTRTNINIDANYNLSFQKNVYRNQKTKLRILFLWKRHFLFDACECCRYVRLDRGRGDNVSGGNMYDVNIYINTISTRAKHSHPARWKDVKNVVKSCFLSFIESAEFGRDHTDCWSISPRVVKFDIWIGSDWPKIGQIWYFLRSVSVHFTKIY